VKIHTGKGLDSYPHHYYWGLSDYVWDNDGDTATIKNRNGKVVDRCSYTSSSGGTKVC